MNDNCIKYYLKHAMLTATALLVLQVSAQTAPATPVAPATAVAPPRPLDATASDPVTMGWMMGSPPSADKLILFANGGPNRFPMTRWAFSNIRQFGPTTNVWRGTSAPTPLTKSDRTAQIDALNFTPMGATESMSWAQSLSANYTDSIVVMHQGKVVYEKYFGVSKPQSQHIAMSVTKSFFGTIGAILVADGTLDETAPVSKYVPELKDTGYGDATVRQLLDMTTGIQYSENYADPKAEIWSHVRAGNILPRPPNYEGPKTFYEFLQTIKKEGEHGQTFAYKTVNTDALGWVIRRVTGKSIGDNLQERIWSKLGVEQDAYFMVDTVGNEFAGGGLNASLRDMARFGEMMRLDGNYNGQQIVPKAVVADIQKGGNKVNFAKAGYKLLPDWSYRNMWWVSHNEHGAYAARGIHGQTIYIDPKAEMVIARFASHPTAANAALDPTSLPAYHALAKLLMK